ncbi:hypothetical protein CPHO_08430 [Corynebacterium phocae]|uniref:Uncharacterized protein n=1 Tax=Corynebacterium phocae TaxID=161895 RepID=A0A1L7D437_9CORY|nr:hypothetical protein [Corynebacterium phocae]APT92909.1 hypothetical protein CPHO_08430 [Corynebacterium phocae]KAA8723233.1 hypothetical protein F4V58_07925 [Corynebacterium phocae]
MTTMTAAPDWRNENDDEYLQKCRWVRDVLMAVAEISNCESHDIPTDLTEMRFRIITLKMANRNKIEALWHGHDSPVRMEFIKYTPDNIFKLGTPEKAIAFLSVRKDLGMERAIAAATPLVEAL